MNKQTNKTKPHSSCVYTAGLLQRLYESGVGCYISNVSVAALTYADDVVFCVAWRKGLRRAVAYRRTGWDWSAGWLWSNDLCTLCNYPQFHKWSCMWNVIMQVLSSYNKNNIQHCLTFINEVLRWRDVGNSDDIMQNEGFSKSFYIKAKIQVRHTNLHNKAFICHKCLIFVLFVCVHPGVLMLLVN